MQHSAVDSRSNNKPIAIEVGGEPQGVVVAAPDGFRFLAVRFNAFAIDGQIFPSIEAAEQAVGRAVGNAEEAD